MIAVWAIGAVLVWLVVCYWLGRCYRRSVKAAAKPHPPIMLPGSRDATGRLVVGLQSQVNDYFNKQFPGVLDGRPFFTAAAETEPYRFNPYEYWRDKWVTTGDLEALEQMTKQVIR